MIKSNITFVLFSFNEEKRIELTVRNLIKYGEVLVLDDGSTDKTGEIAQRLGARFLLRPKNDKAHAETPEMFAFVKGHVQTQWVYWSYVDNLLPKTLLVKLEDISKQTEIKYVFVPVYTYLWGDIEHPAIKTSYPCFFMHDYMDFSENKIHGLGKFTGQKNEIYHIPQELKYAMRHFSLYDLNKFITGHLRYANSEAQEKFKEGKKFSVAYMFGSMGHYFYLFYKCGWRMGVKGLYVALLYVFFRLMLAVRLYELENNLTLESIEAQFVKAKISLVEEIEKN